MDLPREYVERCILDINSIKMRQNSKSTERDTLMKKLLRHDQLLQTIAAGRAFPEFNEGKIAFLPTFKFDKGTSTYDSSYKQRVPAWTDRILFKSKSVRVITYQSADEAMHSDHRPVYGTFQLGWGRTEVVTKKRKSKSQHVKRRKSKQ